MVKPVHSWFLLIQWSLAHHAVMEMRIMETRITTVHVPSLWCGAELTQDHPGASVLRSLLPGHLQPHPPVPHRLCHHWFTCIWGHSAEQRVSQLQHLPAVHDQHLSGMPLLGSDPAIATAV